MKDFVFLSLFIVRGQRAGSNTSTVPSFAVFNSICPHQKESHQQIVT